MIASSLLLKLKQQFLSALDDAARQARQSSHVNAIRFIGPTRDDLV